MRRAWRNIAVLLCGAIFVSAALWAQYPKVARQRPGSLNGKVISAKGTPVAGAMIMWQASDGGIPHVLHSDGQGRFHVRRLRTGLYEVRASAGRTWSVWKQNVMVPPGGAANVTLRLAFEAPSVAAVELKGTMRTWNVPVVGALPHDPAVDPKGNIWFTLQASGHLARFNPDTHVWKLFKVPTPDSGSHGLVSDANGKIWYVESAASANKLVRFNPAVEVFTVFAMPAPDSSVRNIARDARGRLWMPLSLPDKIMVVE